MKIYYSLLNDAQNSKLKSKELLITALSLNGFNVDISSVSKTDKGRPYIKNLPVDFNISHTKGMAAVVICNKYNRVGIDCQKITSTKTRVKERVCTNNELNILNASSNIEEDFIRLWAFKEAFTKMIGSGFAYGFKNATIENAFCLYNNFKMHQEKIGDIILVAVQDKHIGHAKTQVIRI